MTTTIARNTPTGTPFGICPPAIRWAAPLRWWQLRHRWEHFKNCLRVEGYDQGLEDGATDQAASWVNGFERGLQVAQNVMGKRLADVAAGPVAGNGEAS